MQAKPSGGSHFARKVGVVEFVRIAQAFAWDELDIFAAKGVAFARCKVAEGHFEGAPDLRFQMMHRAGKAVGRQPLGERVRFQKRAIDFFRLGCQNAMQFNGVRHEHPSLG